MTDPVRTIADRVRTRVLREGVDLAGDSGIAARYAHEEVRHYSERALAGAHAQLGDEHGTMRTMDAGRPKAKRAGSGTSHLRTAVSTYCRIRILDATVRGTIETALDLLHGRYTLAHWGYINEGWPYQMQPHVLSQLQEIVGACERGDSASESG